MKNIFLLIIFSFNACFFSSCLNKNKGLDFSIEQDIECFSLSYPDILGISMQLLKEDSILLINDFRGDSLIHMFDVKNKTILRKLIPVGNGPNELISPLEVHIKNSDLFLFCRQTYILYHLPIVSLINGNKSMVKNFQTSYKVNHLFPLTDSLFIASGLFDKRYAFINCSGDEVKEFGEYPVYWEKEKQYSTKVRAMFHQTQFEKHPMRSFFLSYSSHTLEIYDYSSNVYQPVLVKNMLIGDYNYSFVDNGTILSTQKGKDVERGIVSVGCSSDYIYVIYNPNQTNDGNLGSQIQVIDWNGQPIKMLNCKKEITCLYIDEKEQKGYVIVKDPDDSLMYFDL